MWKVIPSLLTLSQIFSVASPADFPIVPDDIEVTIVATEPMVRNPCAMTFDAKGRLCVGMGPQYRTPKPETPGDSVWILTDLDGDGIADKRVEFARGLNAIQGLAWKGRDLWIANAPDLTVVRDLDGDDVADEYVRVYTDLGNLEHALHGLNFGPDGKLYMSKGNSKGLTQLPDRIAPQPFRELWGIDVPQGRKEPQPVTFRAESYEKNYHDPRDDWGITGGILRCDDDGSNLEIVCRGFRNPWDICFDDGFNWLGTDNDQTMGDKIFAPFYGAHFGWGHTWSYDWKGDDHLPTAPSSGPLFEGSGAGVIFCGLEHYPEKYRGVFFINDWLRREVYIYRPAWDGARRVPDSEMFDLLAHAGGGRSMQQSSGRAFDPVDIEIGPDGAIWISSWGRQYGAHYENDDLANEGRIYRLWPKSASPRSWRSRRDPLTDLGSHLPVWRTNAQEAILKQPGDYRDALWSLAIGTKNKTQQTWALWTLARMAPEKIDEDRHFEDSIRKSSDLNHRIQCIRALAFRAVERGSQTAAPVFAEILQSDEPRMRHEAVLALHQIGDRQWKNDLVALAARELDRIVYYSTWKALIDLMPRAGLEALLSDERMGVRRAGFLSLLEEDALTEDQIRPFANDPDPSIAALAEKRLGGKAKFEQRGRPLKATHSNSSAKSQIRNHVVPFENIRASSGRRYRAAVLEPGTRLYTDRDYSITEVPAELTGETFLQTSCSDADQESGIEVSLDLMFPSTVFLIDDARAEALPAWARDQWEPTEMIVKGTDPNEMRVFRREMPAGTLILGTNRDGVKARKGNYLVAVRPKMLAPDGTVATMESVLAEMTNADPKRGRVLFLSRHGAACSDCHQLEGIGNHHAPDLSEIGSRADANVIIESILDPSATITEGFAAQAVTTMKGETFSGIILRETGRAVTVAMTGGATIEIPRGEIVKREGLPISAMPASFSAMLRPSQIADITTYLLTLKGREPLRMTDGEFNFHRDGDRLHIFAGKTRIATHLLDDPVLTRRAFVNVRTPSGIPVTREWPAPQNDDHPTMHPGIWIGFGWIDGNDYWRLRSKVEFDRFLAEPKANRSSATFATRNRYLNEAGDKTVCVADAICHLERIPEGVLLRVDTTFYNDERDFAFGDQEESGLAIRMARPLTVQHGNGSIVNDAGDRDGSGTWGKEFRWIDYSGEQDGRRAGILVIPHPDNPRPCWSHSRDYGALVANPFPKQPKERREPYVTTPVKKGERFRLRYTLLIHETDANQPFDPAKIYEKIK